MYETIQHLYNKHKGIIMFKILVTTYAFSDMAENPGIAVHSLVIEFDTEKEAAFASDKINDLGSCNNKTNNFHDNKQVAISLFQKE